MRVSEFFPGVVGTGDVADADGICRIQPVYGTIAQVDTGYAVAGGCHDERKVKTHFTGTGNDGAVPVDGSLSTPQSQMPFADGGSAVACLLHHRRQGQFFPFDGKNQFSVARQDIRTLTPPGILAGKEGIAGGRTDGCGAVGICKGKPLCCQPIQVGAGYFAASGDGGVVIAQIIHIEEQDGLRFFGS